VVEHKKVDTSYERQPWFTVPGTRAFADSLLSRSTENLLDPGNSYRQQGLDFLSGLVNGEPINWKPSAELEDSLNSIRQASDAALPGQLANTRSQYYRGPAGRSMMALDDSLMQNKAQRDLSMSQLMQQQYNQDVGVMGNAANNLINTDASDFAQAMDVARLLIGEKGSGSSMTSSGLGTGQMLGGLGGFLGGLGALGGTGGLSSLF
jgi:hypothetical protein